MSLETIRPYFQAVMFAVDPEFREHDDAFDIENVANTLLDFAWHIQIGQAGMESFNQACLSYNVPLVLNAWVKGHRTPLEAVDNGLIKLEAIIKESSRHSRRLTQPYIKNVLPTGFSVDAISGSNDNITKITINFSLLVHMDIDT